MQKNVRRLCSKMFAICMAFMSGLVLADGVSPVAGNSYRSTYSRDEYGGNYTTMTFFGGPYTMSSELRDQITFDLTSVPDWVTVYAGNWSKVSSGVLTQDSTTKLTSGISNNIYGRYGYGFDFVYAFTCGVNKGAARSCSFSFSRKIVKGTSDWSASRWTGTVTINQDACSSIKYTITYAPGTYGSGSSVSDTKAAGATLTLRNALFTRTGYSQQGWSKSTYGTTKAYSLGGSYTTDAAATLYPYWVANTYTVTLNMQGGSGGTSSKTVTYGSAMPSITVPTRDGYVFGGYYTGTEGTGTKYYNEDGSSAHIYDFTASKTLYAKWIQHTATSYGLMVGIDNYDTSAWQTLGFTVSSLAGCVHDSQSMKMVCTDYGNWDADNIVVLTNGMATLSRFRNAISTLAAQAYAGDTVLIYDSSHGGCDTTGSKDVFLVTYDAKYWDSTFASDIANFRTGVKVIVVLDTCLSAGMFKSLSKGISTSGAPTFASSFIQNVSEQIDLSSSKTTKALGVDGASKIASSEIGWIAAADYSITSSDLGGMGLFTGYMVVDSGILAGNADANSDGKITFNEIYEHAVGISDQYSLSQVAQAANTSVLSSVSVDNKYVSLATALDNDELSFLTYNVIEEDGPASWVGQNLTSGCYARSAVLPNSNQAVLGFNVSGAGTLSFKWKVSSEAKWDKLSFIVDDVTNAVISGEQDWTSKSVALDSGSHEIVWSYSKDISYSKGEDCGWLDQVTWTPVTVVNDDFANAVTVSGKSGSTTGSNVGATSQSGEPIISFKPTATTTVWWKWVAPSSGTVQFDTIGTGFDTVMGVYTGSSISALTTVVQDDDGGTSQTSKCLFDCISGTTYYICVAGYGAKTGAITLNWNLTTTYTITYKPGANGTGTEKTATKTYGVALTLLGETFTRTGYTQTGWATTDGGSQAYALGATYTVNAAKTLYPVWTPITYTITYSPGSNGTGTQQTATKTYGVALTLFGETFTREGYTQTGWATTDGGTQAYALGASYTANSAQTLYPVWTLNTYTVTYNPGTYGSGAQQTATKYHGQPLTLLGASYTRSGYSQTGWTTSDGSQTYAIGASYTANADIVLYPIWKKIVLPSPDPSVISTALDCDLLDFTEDTSATSVEYWQATNDCMMVSGLGSNQWSSIMATVHGPCFVDWDWMCTTNTSSCALYLFLDNQATNGTNSSAWKHRYFYVGEGEHTLDWCFIQGTIPSGNEGGLAGLRSVGVFYPVSYDLNGGTGSLPAPTGWEYGHIEETGATNFFYAVDAEIAVANGGSLVKQGYVFAGWTCSLDGEVYDSAATYTVPETSTVFTAKWVLTPTYSVTYKPGVNGEGAQQTATKTQDVALALLGSTFTRAGYTQTGWATTDGGEQVYALGATYTANAAITLYPVWTANTYTITYMPGSNGAGAQQSATKTHGVDLTLLGATFTRDGYTQTGWATSDGGAQAYALGGTFVLDEDVALYPVWTADPDPSPDPYENPGWKTNIVVKLYKQSVFAQIYDVAAKTYLEHAVGMLAAFKDGECRGCTTLLNGPTCKLFQLSVGIESVAETGFTLKYWNPEVGVIDVLDGFDANENKKIGSITAPVTYRVGALEATITMKSGWNWVSIPVQPTDLSLSGILGGFSFADEDSVVSADGTASYYGGLWYSGDFDEIVPGAGYCIKKSTAGTQTTNICGAAIDNTATVKVGWNWIGCPSVQSVPLADVTHSAGFADEDEINSADGIAVCYSGVWYSSDFDSLEPGAAYVAKLARAGTLTFGGSKTVLGNAVLTKSLNALSIAKGASPTWKDEIVVQPESLSLFCKITKGVGGELIETDGSMLGVFAANGECRGATTILTVPSLGKFFQLKVGAATTSETGFTLKVWDAETGKTYDVDGTFGFADCTGEKKIGAFTSPVTKVAIVEVYPPPLPPNPTPDDVYAALEGSADSSLQTNITEPEEYNAYSNWSVRVKSPGGTSVAGPQAVKDSPNAWLSYALGSETLIENAPTNGQMKVEKFEPTATAGSFDFTVKIDDIPVGDDATPSNLAKVFGIEGGASPDSGSMSSANVNITFGTPENGKVKFTAGPKNTNEGSFFMRVKMTP